MFVQMFVYYSCKNADKRMGVYQTNPELDGHLVT